MRASAVRVRCQRWARCFQSSSAGLAADVQSSKLRPYQLSVIQRAVDLYGKGTRRLLVPLATGLGKTVVFTHLPQAFPELGRRGTLVLVHRDELVQQAVASFRKFMPHLAVGVEKGSQTAHPGLDVVVASVQTLGRRGSGAARLRKYVDYGGVVVVDEAHHVKAGGMYDDVLNQLGVGSACRGKTRDGRLLAGFTATPRRADGLSLRPFFDHSIGGLDLYWGISSGYLVDIHAYVVKTATDIGAVPVQMQDFSAGALSTAVNNTLRNEAAARAMLEFGAGVAAGGTESPKKAPRGIAFCADVRHAHDLAAVLNGHGISALAIDGGMNKQERHRILSAFRSGEVSTLTNCGVLTEGFDAPFCDTVLMCRPTQSAPLYMQMMGRGTRPWLPPAMSPPEGTPTAPLTTPAERKGAISASPKPRMHVIDMVDNCGKHTVMSVPAVLGLSPEFGGDGRGGEFSVQHVASLAAEVRSIVDGDFSDERGESPLTKANTPRELALLVKHYRLMQGSKAAKTIVTMASIDREESQSPTPPHGWDVGTLNVGDRIGKETLLKVIVEAIETGKEDGTEADFDSEDDHLADEDCCCGSEDENMSGGFSKKPPNRKGAKRIGRRKQASAAATVHMRHEASSVLLTWRTAGVKDTCGEELHEGGAYRLVATVRDPPDVSNRAVEVTRCRLTSVASAEK